MHADKSLQEQCNVGRKGWKSDGNWAGKDPAVGCQGHREGGKSHWSHFGKQITPSSHLGGELPKEMTEWKSWKEAMCPNPFSYTEGNWGWGQRLNDLSKTSQAALVVKNLPANAGDTRDVSSIPGLGRSPGVGNGNLLQYSCLKNSMDRRAWWATVCGASRSQTWLSTGIGRTTQR